VEEIHAAIIDWIKANILHERVVKRVVAEVRRRIETRAGARDELLFRPTETPAGKRYEVTGRLAVGGLLRLPAGSREIASHGGPEPLWNRDPEGHITRVPMYLTAC
jgi:hypothetical protein